MQKTYSVYKKSVRVGDSANPGLPVLLRTRETPDALEVILADYRANTPGIRTSYAAGRKFLDKKVSDNVREYPTKGKAGRVVRSSRLYGVELELVRGKDEVRASADKTTALTVKSDGSVNGQGIEVVTVPTSGRASELMLDLLDLQSASTDRSCGMHIHIDARDFWNMQEKGLTAPLRRLVCLYMASQDILFSLVPNSRRANTYTKHIHVPADLLSFYDDAESGIAWIKHNISQGDRYRFFNLQPYYREGHYEVRLHQGTSDKRKVLEWANLHTAMADAAMRKGVVTKELVLKLLHNDTTDGLDILCDTLGLSEQSTQYWKNRRELFRNHRTPECDICGSVEDYQNEDDGEESGEPGWRFNGDTD